MSLEEILCLGVSGCIVLAAIYYFYSKTSSSK
jgi:hypothetical protein